MSIKPFSIYVVFKIVKQQDTLTGDLQGYETSYSVLNITRLNSLDAVKDFMQRLPFDGRPGGDPAYLISYRVLEIEIPSLDCKEVSLATLGIVEG